MSTEDFNAGLRLFEESQAAYRNIERLEHVHYLDLRVLFEAVKTGNHGMIARTTEKLLANEQHIADARQAWRNLHERVMAYWPHMDRRPDNPHLVEDLKMAGGI